MTNSETTHTLQWHSQFPTTRWTLVIAAGDPRRKKLDPHWVPLRKLLISVGRLSAPPRLSGRSGSGFDAGVLHPHPRRPISRSR